MSTPQVEIIVIAALTAVACALPGVFLVLRRMSLLSDAISHAILVGIVIAFFVVHDLNSPLLIVAAMLTGVLTVALVELLVKTGRLREDASIGLVFPALFSIGVILISRYAGNIHLDTDAVLLGELVYAPFDRAVFLGLDAPRALWTMAAVLGVNLVFIGLLYKELKLTTFDAGLATALGITPAIIHYALMTVVSLTAVTAFDAVGSILVVALVIAPPAAAYMLTDRLPVMLGLAALFGAVSAVLGYLGARAFDSSIAGSIAVVCGLIFVAAIMFAPGRGLLPKAVRASRQRIQFAAQMLAVHLLNHEGTPEEAEESEVGHIDRHLRWDPLLAHRVLAYSQARRLVTRQGNQLRLTPLGRETARDVIART
jgi:manganese/zinc/iron transport system permease protein